MSYIRHYQYFSKAAQDLGPITALLLGYLYYWANMSLECYADRETIAKDLGITEDDTTRAIDRLMKKGLAKRGKKGLTLTEKAMEEYCGIRITDKEMFLAVDSISGMQVSV